MKATDRTGANLTKSKSDPVGGGQWPNSLYYYYKNTQLALVCYVLGLPWWLRG